MVEHKDDDALARMATMGESIDSRTAPAVAPMTRIADIFAEQIADLLLVNAFGERADRLVLTVDRPAHRDLGGWNRSAIVALVSAALMKPMHPDWPRVALPRQILMCSCEDLAACSHPWPILWPRNAGGRE